MASAHRSGAAVARLKRGERKYGAWRMLAWQQAQRMAAKTLLARSAMKRQERKWRRRCAAKYRASAWLVQQT
jgi:hypothetical protein